MQYFSQGSKILPYLAQANLFKDYYKLEPGYVQELTSIAQLPWTCKIIYGVISDNIPICGSRRRIYCILLSALQVTTTLILSSYLGTNELIPTACMFLISLTIAAMDVIVDSIMVIQARRYPENGSEEL